MHILIVEDDPVQLRGLALYLTDAGHEVSSASLALEAALLLASGVRFDAAVLDVCLPGSTGLAVLDALRAKPEYRALPVVVTSGLPVADLADAAERSDPLRGGVTILQKPFELPALLAALEGAKGG